MRVRPGFNTAANARPEPSFFLFVSVQCLRSEKGAARHSEPAEVAFDLGRYVGWRVARRSTP